MKITIKDNAKQAEIKYPCLMESAGKSLYYMMTHSVVFCLTEQEWSEDYDRDEFTPFTGTVELSND